jgi:hypothetical protein
MHLFGFLFCRKVCCYFSHVACDRSQQRRSLDLAPAAAVALSSGGGGGGSGGALLANSVLQAAGLVLVPPPQPGPALAFAAPALVAAGAAAVAHGSYRLPPLSQAAPLLAWPLGTRATAGARESRGALPVTDGELQHMVRKFLRFRGVVMASYS